MLQIRRSPQSTEAYVPDFGNPLGLMAHCHRKIEAHLLALEASARSLADRGVDARASILPVIAAAQAHFAGPGVKHTADEEESLFPRLRRFATDADAHLVAALEHLERQHRELDAVHAQFDGLVGILQRDPSPADIASLGLRVAELAATYGPHIRMEEEVVFPEAARVLPEAEILAVGAEMRARRGLPARSPESPGR